MSKKYVKIDDPRVQVVEDGTAEALLFTSYEYNNAIRTLRKEYTDRFAAGVWRPISNLIGTCAELAMKSMLLHDKMEADELKYKYGHNLNKLLIKCVENGLVINNNHFITIERLSITISTHYFRYGREEDGKLPWPVPVTPIDDAIEALNVLITAAAVKLGHISPPSETAE